MEKARREAVDSGLLALLLQRRYNIFRDIKSATDELSLALSRNDAVSAELILQIRGDYLDKCESNWQELLQLSEESPETAEYMKRLLFCAVEEAKAGNTGEERVITIRRSIDSVLRSIQEEDRVLNLRSAKGRSYYQN